MRGSVMAAMVALGACGGSESGTSRNAATGSPPTVQAEDDIVSVPARTEPGTPSSVEPPGSPPQDAGSCGASDYQYLVGKPRSSIPEKPQDASWRIACSGCPVTMDYSLARMNIFYDEETQIVEEVECG